MSRHKFNLPDKDKKLLATVENLLNQRKYSLAKKKIYKRLEMINGSKSQIDFYLLAELSGFLIDICEEGKDEEAGKDGLKILKKLGKNWPDFLWKASYEYNLGNAHESLFKVKQARGEVEFKPNNIDLLKKAKDCYWRAYKLNASSNYYPFQPNFLVNLGNSLSRNGRVIEAFQFFDLALKLYPDFPKAHANRSEALLWLNRLSGSLSMNLLYQAMEGYNFAAKSEFITPWMSKIFDKNASQLYEILNSHGYSKDDFAKETQEIEKDRDIHSNYRNYCLNNNLALSEHSIYCHCVGARRDNLMIPTPNSSLIGDFVPKMEHILNRIKSEFSLARLLFFQVEESQKDQWETYENEVVFTELDDKEAIGIESEMLRTSFRLCYGILDKIAEGICELFELSKGKDEHIYFHNFWKRNNKRWKEINNIDNISLTALYSQAHDLYGDRGEWSMFKKWRDSLEHKLFVIREKGSDKEDPFNIFSEKRGIIEVNYANFVDKTLHLLQFTRSAIFNFVFLVRNEGRKGDNPGDVGIPITFNFK